MKIRHWMLILLGCLTILACSVPITKGKVIGVIPVTQTKSAVLLRQLGRATATWYLLPEGYGAAVGDSVAGRARRVETGDY